jgi:hypothetical protein
MFYNSRTFTVRDGLEPADEKNGSKYSRYTVSLSEPQARKFHNVLTEFLRSWFLNRFPSRFLPKSGIILRIVFSRDRVKSRIISVSILVLKKKKSLLFYFCQKNKNLLPIYTDRKIIILLLLLYNIHLSLLV